MGDVRIHTGVDALQAINKSNHPSGVSQKPNSEISTGEKVGRASMLGNHRLRKPRTVSVRQKPNSKPPSVTYNLVLKRALCLYNKDKRKNLDELISDTLKPLNNQPQQIGEKTLNEWKQDLKNDITIIQLLGKDNKTQTYKKSNDEIIKELVKFNNDLSKISNENLVKDLTEFCNNCDIDDLKYDPSTLSNFLKLEASLFANPLCQNQKNKYIKDCTIIINVFAKSNWSGSEEIAGSITNPGTIDFAFTFIINNLADYRNSVTKELNRLTSANDKKELIKEAINSLESFFKVGNEILNNNKIKEIYTNSYIGKIKKYLKQFSTSNMFSTLNILDIFNYDKNDNFFYEIQNEFQNLSLQDVKIDYYSELARQDGKNLSKYIFDINKDKSEAKLNLKTLFEDNVLVQGLYFIKAHNILNSLEEKSPNLYWLTTFLYINRFPEAEDELKQSHCLSLHLSSKSLSEKTFKDSFILSKLLEQKDHYSDEFFLSTLSKFDLSTFTEQPILNKINNYINQIDLTSFNYSKNIDFLKSSLKVFSDLMTNHKAKLIPKQTDDLREIFKQLISKGDEDLIDLINELKNNKTIHKQIRKIIHETLKTNPKEKNVSNDLQKPSA